MAQDATQDDDGEFLLFKFNKENAPRLAGRERTKLVNLFNLDRVLVLQAKFFRLIFKGEIVETARFHWPSKFGFQVANQIGEFADVAELVGGGHIG